MEIIKYLRKEHKITQDKLAKAMGVSRSTVSMWEIDASEPDNEMLNKLASFFDVSTDLLLGHSINDKKPVTSVDDELYKQIYDIVSQLSPDNRQKLIELAGMYLASQNNKKGIQ